MENRHRLRRAAVLTDLSTAHKIARGRECGSERRRSARVGFHTCAFASCAACCVSAAIRAKSTAAAASARETGWEGL
eukprot:4352651-Pleurochrysis_carterae.AAC.1